MLTNWVVHTGSDAPRSARDLQWWFRRPFYFLRSLWANLTRKHTDNWINWINEHIIMAVSIVYHWSYRPNYTTVCLNCGRSFTTIETHYYRRSKSGHTCKVLSRNTWKALRYKFMSLLLKYHLSVWLQKSRGTESLVDQRGEMRFWCEQPGCCKEFRLCSTSASCVSPA